MSKIVKIGIRGTLRGTLRETKSRIKIRCSNIYLSIKQVLNAWKNETHRGILQGERKEKRLFMGVFIDLHVQGGG